MEKLVTLIFQNKSKDEYKVDFKTYKNIPSSVLDVWTRTLHNFLNIDNGRVQVTFNRFPIEGRDNVFLAKKLESIISYINSSFLNTEYGYEIKRTSVPLDYPIEVHNELHHHFEVLIGQVWNPSPWWELIMNSGDKKLVNAVLALNDISHELEEYTTENIPPHYHLLFEYPDSVENHTLELPEEVRDIFSIGAVEGGVYLNYTQLGKTLEEVINENDEEIFEENISAHRLVNGSFSLCFEGEDESEQKQQHLREQYRELAEKKGIPNLDDPRMTIGRPLIGKIVGENYQEIYHTLIEYNKLVKIETENYSKVINPFTDRFE
jgi:hypothetical protein